MCLKGSNFSSFVSDIVQFLYTNTKVEYFKVFLYNNMLEAVYMRLDIIIFTKSMFREKAIFIFKIKNQRVWFLKCCKSFITCLIFMLYMKFYFCYIFHIYAICLLYIYRYIYDIYIHTYIYIYIYIYILKYLYLYFYALLYISIFTLFYFKFV